MNADDWDPVQLKIEDEKRIGHLDARFDGVNGWEYFAGLNDFELPQLLPETWEPERLVAYHDQKGYGPDAAVHFFLDDYRFERTWRSPHLMVERFREVGAVLTPDFSVYREMPLPVLIWNTYRNRWLGAFWQARRIRVIPTVGWTVPDDMFFMGLPKKSTLAISSNGITDDLAVELFQAGVERLMELLEPTTLICYGDLKGCESVVPNNVALVFPSFWEAKKQEIA